MHKQVQSHTRMGAHQGACQRSLAPHTLNPTCVSMLHACVCLYLPACAHGNRHTQAWADNPAVIQQTLGAGPLCARHRVRSWCVMRID